ncbi:MAG: hypothetical protein ACYDAY_08470 [Candidatus Dormibacteria bacterium]
MPQNSTLSMGLFAVAALMLVLAVLYLLRIVNFLAHSNGPHITHAILFTGLAVLCAVAGNFARPKPVR